MLKKWSIKFRLTMSYVSILVLVILLVLMSYYNISNSATNFNKLIDEDVAHQLMVEDSKDDVNEIARLLRDQAISGMDLDKMTQIEQAAIGLNDTLAYFKETYPDNQEAQVYFDEVNAWFNVFHAINESLVANDLEEVQTLITEQCTPQLEAALAAGNAFSSYISTTSAEDIETVNDQILFNAYAMFAITAIIILIIVFISIDILKLIIKPLTKLQNSIVAFSEGNLAHELDYTSSNEMGKISDSVRLSQKILGEVIADITDITGEIVNGNLTVRIDKTYPGDLAPVKDNLINLISFMNDTMNEIGQMSSQVSAGSDQVSNGAQALAQGASEQAAAVEQLSATIVNIDTSAQQNAVSANDAAQKSQLAGGQVAISGERMKELRSAMNDIAAGQQDISKILNTIENIAFQTNILALNAAVEAARAGTAGKGFAVVADEVRNLASKSDLAAKQTKTLIESLMEYIDKGNSLTQQVENSLEETTKYAGEAMGSINELSAAAAAEAEAIAQLTTGMDQISAVVQSNSATSEESAAASEELSSQAFMMRDMIQKFKLSDGSSGSSSNSGMQSDSDYGMSSEQASRPSKADPLPEFKNDYDDKY